MSKVTEAATQLPDGAEYALVVFAERIQNYRSSIKGDLVDDDTIFVQQFVRRFTEKFKVAVGITYPETGDQNARAMVVIGQILREKPKLLSKKLDRDIDGLLSEYAISSESTFGLARLNADEKKKILDSIERIRQLIESSSLAARKKNALFERLAELTREVNTHGTRTDRFFAFAGDVGFVLGDMANKAKPLIHEVKEVLKIVSRSRGRQEGVSLPPGDEVLRLSGPDGSVEE